MLHSSRPCQEHFYFLHPLESPWAPSGPRDPFSESALSHLIALHSKTLSEPLVLLTPLGVLVGSLGTEGSVFCVRGVNS